MVRNNFLIFVISVAVMAFIGGYLCGAAMEVAALSANAKKAQTVFGRPYGNAD